MAILEITNGLSTKEFELSIAEDRKEYYSEKEEAIKAIKLANNL